MAKNKQSNLIASVKMLDTNFMSKYIMNSVIGGGDYLVLVNYQSLLSNLFPSTPQLFFSRKYKRNRLLCLSFTKL